MLPYPVLWSYLVAAGEVLVGIALILGLLTGIAAFFGSFMNASYLLAGTVSINPALFIIATWLVLEDRRLVGAGPLGAACAGCPLAARLHLPHRLTDGVAGARP